MVVLAMMNSKAGENKINYKDAGHYNDRALIHSLNYCCLSSKISLSSNTWPE